jgi:hypothetical protein
MAWTMSNIRASGQSQYNVAQEIVYLQRTGKRVSLAGVPDDLAINAQIISGRVEPVVASDGK